MVRQCYYEGKIIRIRLLNSGLDSGGGKRGVPGTCPPPKIRKLGGTFRVKLSDKRGKREKEGKHNETILA